MSLAMNIAEAKLSLQDSCFGIGIGSAEFDFILNYVQFLVARDLATLDVDLFMHLWEDLQDLQLVGRFIAPLTLRGRELARVIAETSESFAAHGISVVQGKLFIGLADFEIVRRIVVVERFKATIDPRH
jgi:hypothetical protein